MSALEKHYRVSEIAVLWSVSKQTVIRLFAAEPGVLVVGSPKRRTFSIPESVMIRVHGRVTQATKPRTPKIIRLRERKAA